MIKCLSELRLVLLKAQFSQSDEMTGCIQHSNAKNAIFTIYKEHDFYVDRTKLFDLIRHIKTLSELLHNLIKMNFQVPTSR